MRTLGLRGLKLLELLEQKVLESLGKLFTETLKKLKGSEKGRTLLKWLGHIFIALAIVGSFLPGLPWYDPLVLAALFYANSSEKCYLALLNNPRFSPVLRQWQEHGTISKKTKIKIVAMIVVSFGVTIAFTSNPYARVG